MNREKIELIKLWFLKADNDLLNIENNLDNTSIPTDTICFHSQQAIEKYFKAFLIYRDKEIIKTHDLIELMNCIKDSIPELLEYSDELENITGYAVDVRYVDNYYLPSLNESVKSYETAKKIKKIIISKINFND